MKKSLLAVVVLILIAFTLIRPTLTSNLRIFPYSIEGTWLSQVKFIARSWPNIFWNPSWFLGYPTRFSSNPLFTVGLGVITKLFAGGEPLSTYRLAVGVSFCSLPVALYYFLRGLKFRRSGAFLSSSWLILGPSLLCLFPQVFVHTRGVGFPSFSLFSAYLLGNGPKVMALPVALFSLIFYKKFLEEDSKWCLLATVFLAVAAVLVSSSVVVFLLVGAACILLSEIMVNLQKWEDYFTRFIFTLLCCLTILAVWYTPAYWLHSLTTPSLAGKSLLAVLAFLLKVVITSFPILLGAWLVKGRVWVRDERRTFAFWFSLGFGFLTITRFIADFDFWQDYTAYGVEVDIGVSVIVGLLSEWILRRVRGKGGRLRRHLLSTTFLLLVGSLFFWRYHTVTVQNLSNEVASSYEDSYEYRIANFLKNNMASEERVFVSGSLVFWLNYFAPEVMQVRGGDDSAAIHPYWSHGAYQIREGEDPELADLWLKALGASWVVVHTENSLDPYHDFKHTEKFTQMEGWDRVYEQKGDAIYRLSGVESNSLFARMVDVTAAGVTAKPQGGNDKKALQEYVDLRNSYWDYKIDAALIGSQGVDVEFVPREGKAVSLDAAFTPSFQVISETDNENPVSVRADRLGNILLEPRFTADTTRVRLVYRVNRAKRLVGIIICLGGLALIVTYPCSSEWLKNKVSEFNIIDKEDDY